MKYIYKYLPALVIFSIIYIVNRIFNEVSDMISMIFCGMLLAILTNIIILCLMQILIYLTRVDSVFTGKSYIDVMIAYFVEGYTDLNYFKYKDEYYTTIVNDKGSVNLYKLQLFGFIFRDIDTISSTYTTDIALYQDQLKSSIDSYTARIIRKKLKKRERKYDHFNKIE